jgi:hypothetical protein
MTTPSRCTGVVAAARTQGKRAQHGKPQSVVRDDQPDAREGQAGRSLGVAERFVVPRKPGNSGGGKGPQFKTDAERGEGHGDWDRHTSTLPTPAVRFAETRMQQRVKSAQSRRSR